jgi:hypothetical protein
MIKSYYGKYIFSPVYLLLNLFIGCSSSPDLAILIQDYHGQRVYNKNITIIKLFDKAFLGVDEYEITKHLGEGVPEVVYTSFFNQSFPAAFRKTKCFNNVYYVDQYPHDSLEEKTLNLSKNEKMKILMPKENTTIDLDSAKSDYILFVDNLQITNLRSSVFHHIKFAIWDNIKGKIISYGRVEYNFGDLGIMKENLDIILFGIVKKILVYSPSPVKNGFN